MKLDQKTFEIIEKIAEQHSNRTFGYLTKEDLKNEIWLAALEKLKDYKKKKGKLEHFLRVAVKNRLINKFKDITKSVRSPCPRCPYYDKGMSPSDCSLYGHDRHFCKKWKNYQLSVQNRNNLLNPIDVENDKPISNNPLNFAISNEVKNIIIENINPSLLMDFNTLVDGGKLNRHKIKKLKKEIEKVLKDHADLVQLTVKGKSRHAKGN